MRKKAQFYENFYENDENDFYNTPFSKINVAYSSNIESIQASKYYNEMR